VPSPSGSFDEQAPLYDARAGLPAAAGADVARAIVEGAGTRPGDLVVELGAGTGEIGAHFARLAVRYVGLDRSAPMLEVFRGKMTESSPSLVVADCDRPWPLRDGAASVVFASRVVHLLDADHVAREARRVCRPAGCLIVGRVMRDDDGAKARLRRRRRALLANAGLAPRQGEEGTRRVVERCRAAGGTSLGPQVVAEWTGATTPAAVIAGWERLSRMGSIEVDPATRAAILDDLRGWAGSAFGDLAHPQPFRERYVVEVVRFPSRAATTGFGEGPCTTRF